MELDFGVLPVLVPIAVGALEPTSNKRRIGVLASIGAVVSAVLMDSVLRGPVEAHIEHHHLSYNVNLWHGVHLRHSKPTWRVAGLIRA